MLTQAMALKDEIIRLRRESQAQGKKLAIQGLPSQLHDLATVYGIAELLSPT